MTSQVRSIPEDEFEAACLALLDEVATSGEELVVTRDGAPVARVLPPDGKPAAAEILGKGADVPLGLRAGELRAWLLAHANPPDPDAENPLKGSIVYQGDLISPVGEEDWDLLP